MLKFFVFLSFWLYSFCEVFKYRVHWKKQTRTLKPVIVYIKTILFVLTLILLIVNRLLPSGIVERSGSSGSFSVLIVIMGILGWVCVHDLRELKERKGRSK